MASHCAAHCVLGDCQHRLPGEFLAASPSLTLRNAHDVLSGSRLEHDAVDVQESGFSSPREAGTTCELSPPTHRHQPGGPGPGQHPPPSPPQLHIPKHTRTRKHTIPNTFDTEVWCLSSFKESNCTPRSCTSLKFPGFLGICVQERSGLISLVFVSSGVKYRDGPWLNDFASCAGPAPCQWSSRISLPST